MLFTIPFSKHRSCRYHINSDEMVTGVWKLMVRLKLTGIRHAWVLVSRDPVPSDITNEALRILEEHLA